MDVSYTLSNEDEPESGDVRFVRDRLADDTRQHAGDDNHRRLASFLRDSDTTVVAGLVGATYWGWISIAMVWVNCTLASTVRDETAVDCRTGSRPARCHHIHFDTVSLQALLFYRK